MIYRVGVSAEVARTASATRRRHIEAEGGPVLLEFGKNPVFLSFLPTEVEGDPHLVVTPMDEATMRLLGGKLSAIKPSRGIGDLVEENEVPPPPTSPNPSRSADDEVTGAEPTTLQDGGQDEKKSEEEGELLEKAHDDPPPAKEAPAPKPAALKAASRAAKGRRRS